MTFHILGTTVPFGLLSEKEPVVPTRTTMYGPSQLGWNFPFARLDLFSKTLLRTNSLALNIHNFTRRLCQLANLCWYEAIRTASASQSLSIVSRSLIIALVLASSGTSVRMEGNPIYVGMIASIPYVRANCDSPVDFQLVVL